jgi:manganese oxidase
MEKVKNKAGSRRIIHVILTTVAIFIIGYLVTLPNSSKEMMDHSATSEHDDHTSMNQADMELLMKLPLLGPDDRVSLHSVEKDGFKEFHLSVDEIRWEYSKGKFVHAWAYNGQIPGPEIRVNEGDKIRIIVENNLPYKKGTTIHWHGIRLPENNADGVPGLTQQPIKPGETFSYEYTAKNAGTHFYHSHGSSSKDVAMQDDMGLTGPLIVLPKDITDIRHPSNYDREYVFMLDEWAIDEKGENQAVHMVSEGGEHVHGEGTGHDYNVFTINGRAFPDTETLSVKEGERVLVRLINSGSKAIHPMHTHGHAFKVIAIDGNIVPGPVQQTMDVITVHPGERRDIEIIADNPGVWLFHCHDTHHAAGGMIMPFFYEGYEPLV